MHFTVFPVRSVDPILMLVLPILNFMFLVTAGTLTIVGTKPELSRNKKYRHRLYGLYAGLYDSSYNYAISTYRTL